MNKREGSPSLLFLQSKPPVNWWYAQALEGHNTGSPLKRYRHLLMALTALQPLKW